MSRMAFLTLRLGLLPGGAAEPIERRLRAAGVLLDQVEPLDRDEQLVVAVVAELQELLHDVAADDADLLEADELADAVIDVDDEVADLEIAQVGEERRRQPSASGALGRARRSSSKTSRLGVDLQRRRRAAGSRATASPSATSTAPSRCVARRPTPGTRADVVVAQQFDGALGAAVRAGDEQDGVAALARLPDVGDPVGDAAVELRAAGWHATAGAPCADPVAPSSSASSSSASAPRRARLASSSQSTQQPRRRQRRRRASPAFDALARSDASTCSQPRSHLRPHIVGSDDDDIAARPRR